MKIFERLRFWFLLFVVLFGYHVPGVVVECNETEIKAMYATKRKTKAMTEEVEIAERQVNEAIDNLWNSLDQMSINEAAMIFQRVRKKIDENIRELGH